MLHHHLPPWETLKTRLKFNFLASPREDSNRELVGVCKRSQPTHFDEMNPCREGRLCINGTSSDAGVELESLKNAGDYIGYATPDTFDDDGIYLKQDDDPQQA